MSGDDRMSDIAHQLNGVQDRAGFFVEQNLPGRHKDKRLAAILGCSPNMAYRRRRGEGWTVDSLGRASRHFGWAFVNFVYGPLAGQSAGGRDEVSQHVAEFDAAVERFKACVSGSASAVRDAWVLARADAALGGRAAAAGGADLPRAGEAVPAGGGAGERVGARDPGLKAAE